MVQVFSGCTCLAGSALCFLPCIFPFHYEVLVLLVEPLSHLGSFQPIRFATGDIAEPAKREPEVLAGDAALAVAQGQCSGRKASWVAIRRVPLSFCHSHRVFSLMLEMISCSMFARLALARFESCFQPCPDRFMLQQVQPLIRESLPAPLMPASKRDSTQLKQFKSPWKC